MYLRFARANRQCSKICGPDCLREYYETLFQEIEWPSDQAILVHPSSQVRQELKHLRSCCALVSVLYSTRMVQINQIYPKTQLVSLLAEVGGTISMWIGISMLSTYTLLDLLINLCCRKRLAE